MYFNIVAFKYNYMTDLFSKLTLFERAHAEDHKNLITTQGVSSKTTIRIC